MQRYGVSERHACAALGVPRSTLRRLPKKPEHEEALAEDILHLAHQYGRYGYRRITALLQIEGWRINHKRVERIWREQSLKVPKNNLKENGFI